MSIGDAFGTAVQAVIFGEFFKNYDKCRKRIDELVYFNNETFMEINSLKAELYNY